MTLSIHERAISKLRFRSGSRGEVQRAIIRHLHFEKGTTVRALMRRLPYNDQSIQRALRLLRNQKLVYSVPSSYLNTDSSSQILLWYLNG